MIIVWYRQYDLTNPMFVNPTQFFGRTHNDPEIPSPSVDSPEDESGVTAVCKGQITD
jgi:hypothetical protein